MNVLQASAMLVVFGATIYLIAKQNAEAFLALPFASLDVGLQKLSLCPSRTCCGKPPECSCSSASSTCFASTAAS